MAELFNRDFLLNLGGTQIASRNKDGEEVPLLRVAFEVERDLTKDANTASASIYNLKEETRSKVAEKGIETVLEAGYVGFRHVIFRGKLDYGSTQRQGPDWITSFESTDGGDALANARINESFKPGLPLEQAITKAAEALGVGLGNTIDKIRAGNVRGALTEFKNGLVLSGKGSEQVDKLMRMAGYEWSIQDEALQVLEAGEVLDPNEAILLRTDTGLLDSPQAGDDGIVEARALLIPTLRPGKRVNIQSRFVSGFFRVNRSVFAGDTRGGQWQVGIEAKPL